MTMNLFSSFPVISACSYCHTIFHLLLTIITLLFAQSFGNEEEILSGIPASIININPYANFSGIFCLTIEYYPVLHNAEFPEIKFIQLCFFFTRQNNCLSFLYYYKSYNIFYIFIYIRYIYDIYFKNITYYIFLSLNIKFYNLSKNKINLNFLFKMWF